MVVNGSEQYETLILEEDRIVNVDDNTSYLIGVKENDQTYVYMEVVAMEHSFDLTTNTDYFTTDVTDGSITKRIKLFNNIGLEHQLSKEVVITKLQKYGKVYRGGTIVSKPEVTDEATIEIYKQINKKVNKETFDATKVELVSQLNKKASSEDVELIKNDLISRINRVASNIQIDGFVTEETFTESINTIKEKILLCATREELTNLRTELSSLIEAMTTPDGSGESLLANITTELTKKASLTDLQTSENKVLVKVAEKADKSFVTSNINTAKSELNSKINLKANTSDFNRLNNK